jgi:hypothetical protein
MANRGILLNFAKIVFAVVAFMAPSSSLSAQQIAIDRGLRLEGLWCFPLVTDSLQYLFLPDRAFLALDEKQQPQFSFIRYVNSSSTNASSEKTITQAGGGGVLHFLVSYDTDETKVKKAQEALRKIKNNEEIKLLGPIIFKEGRYALVSSILNPETGNREKTLMAMGAAPVLQGSKIALSFEMDPPRSKLLLESFKMTTPDVSIIFDFTFSGILDAYNAKLTVDWAEVQKNEKISGGVNVYFVSAELEKIYENLRRTSAIKLETVGEDAKMQAIVDAAYAKITDMMFRKVEPEQLPAAEQGGLGALLGQAFGRGAPSGGGGFPFSAHVGYKRKDIKTSGFSTLNFNSRSSSERHHYITFNIGDFYKKYGQNQQYFRTVSLSDDDFAQRDIFVGVDGALIPEFDKLINSITVTLRKLHQDGSVTIKEVNIVKAALTDSKPISMNYGSVADTDRLAWLNYDFKAQYNFIGGKTYQTEWQQQNAAMINLFAPYQRRRIQLEGDAALLKSKNVRATTIRVEYPFFGEQRSFETTVKPDDDLLQKQFDITLPAGQYGYKCTIRWRMKDGTEKISRGENDTEILFIDVLN